MLVEAAVLAGITHAAVLSQAALLPDDHDRSARLFPDGRLDQDLQQVDLRDVNSWRLRLHEVSSVELLEIQLVNAVAPFVLNARLKPLMLRAPGRDKHIVNVSAVEGQFYRRLKTTRHPHTNMAKAALNMMTRTSAADYHADGIHMNAVDTGWVSDEDPAAIAARKTRRAALPPAARHRRRRRPHRRSDHRRRQHRRRTSGASSSRTTHPPPGEAHQLAATRQTDAVATLDDLISRFDVTDPAFVQWPYPVLDELREATPIFRDGRTGQWVLTRFAEVHETLRDRRLGRVHPPVHPRGVRQARARPAVVSVPRARALVVARARTARPHPPATPRHEGVHAARGRGDAADGRGVGRRDPSNRASSAAGST